MSRDGGSEPLWAGRFSKGPAPDAHRLGSSLHFDRRLLEQDLAASSAHAHALERAGLLSADEAAELTAALAGDRDWLAGADVDEDVHSTIERVLTERLGELGAKLHAGRSRNDLVVTDLRLWALEAVRGIVTLVEELARALVSRAREHSGAVMPGLTHNRPAQPVTLGYQLNAHGFALLRDLDRLDAWAARTSVSPLGAGALATSTLGLDAAATASELGFAQSFENALDAVSDRDFAIELCAVAAILAVHLSRLAADLARWSDPAVGYAVIDEAYSTGSSMMPQKRNPDVLELARGKAARIAGDLATLLALLSGLPLGYHRDLQEDKEPVFDAVDTLQLVLPALTGCLATAAFDEARMRADAAAEELYATDLAEALVEAGVPFREAHKRVGELLRSCDERGMRMSDLTGAQWAEFGLIDGASLLDPDRSVRARSGPGGPSPTAVGDQSSRIEAAISARVDAPRSAKLSAPD